MRFKTGDLAIVKSNEASKNALAIGKHFFKIGQMVRIVRPHYDNSYDCIDNTGETWYVVEEDLKPVKSKKMIQAMKQAVLDTANNLLKAQNTVTTLEIKTSLIQNYPSFFWKQDFVSDTMEEYYQNALFTYTDNGTYRVYSASPVNPAGVGPAVVTVVQPKVVGVKDVKAKPKSSSISRKKAYELIVGNKGHFFTATFIKQDGDERTINCQYMKGKQDTLHLGYVKVKESVKMKKLKKDTKDGVVVKKANPIRQINLQTLKSLKIGGNFYKIR